MEHQGLSALEFQCVAVGSGFSGSGVAPSVIREMRASMAGISNELLSQRWCTNDEDPGIESCLRNGGAAAFRG